MKRFIPALCLALLAQAGLGADGPGPLFEGALPPLPANQEVVVEQLTLAPGQVGRPHRHDAWVYVYVVQGTVDMQVKGGPVKRLSAGEVFTETPDDIHLTSNNASSTEPAILVVFIIKTAGAPIARPAEGV